jgi:hypothetical protein
MSNIRVNLLSRICWQVTDHTKHGITVTLEISTPQAPKQLRRKTCSVHPISPHRGNMIPNPTSTSQASSSPTSLSSSHPYLPDPSIDAHFRSGVYLGLRMSHLVLSLMSGKLLALVELFGYKGDRKLGLELLERVGG